MGAPRPLVGHVRAGDDLETGADALELLLAEPAGEVFADPAKVRAGGATEAVQTLFGQAHDHRPRIVAGPPSLDEALDLEAIHTTGEGARRDEYPLRQLAHPQRALGSTGESEQHVVGVERECVLGAQLGVERARDLVMGVEEPLPGAQLGVTQAGGGPRLHHMQILHLV